jgi:hypothetical protein
VRDSRSEPARRDEAASSSVSGIHFCPRICKFVRMQASVLQRFQPRG